MDRGVRATSMTERDELQPLLEMGGVLLEGGDGQGSLAAYDAALALAPTNQQALAGKAQCLLALGRREEAVRYLDHAARHHQDDPALWRLLGVASLAAGQGAKAAESFARLQRLAGASVETYLGLAVSHFYAMDREHALSYVDLALLESPESSEAQAWKENLGRLRDKSSLLIGVGRSHCRAGRYSQGLDLFKQAVELKDTAEARLYLGKALLALGQPDEAGIHLRVALDKDPDNQEALLGMAAVFSLLNQPSEALHLLDQVLAVNPDDVDALLGKSESLLSSNKLAEAAKNVERALQLAPSDSEAWMLRAKVTLALGKVVETRVYVDHSICLDIESPRMWQAGGVVLQSSKDKALSALYCAMAGRPLRRGSVVRSIGPSTELGDVSTEAALLGAFVSAHPECSQAYQERATIYEALGELDRSLYYLELMLESRPDDLDVLCQHGGTLLSLRRYRDAAKSFQRALDIDPGNERASKGAAIAREGLQANE